MIAFRYPILKAQGNSYYMQPLLYILVQISLWAFISNKDNKYLHMTLDSCQKSFQAMTKKSDKT